MQPLAEIVQAKESVEAQFLQQPDVTAVDVGYKYVNGKRTDEISIRVMVKNKKKNVPQAQRIPETINGIKTDVIERTFQLHAFNIPEGQVVVQADTTTYNPLKGGVSIGPCRVINNHVYAGTMGLPVVDNVSGRTLLLSNFHVMCVDNQWHVGDDMTQPSRVDTGSCPANFVGKLQRAVLSNRVDGAVCSLEAPTRTTACEVVDIGAIQGTAAAVLNSPVRKRGRTTLLTSGFVDSVSMSVNVDYGPGLGVRTLTGQISIRPNTNRNPAFSDHGDSGSVIVDDQSRVVGLLFAGSADGFTVANPIAEVLSALNIRLCTQGKGPFKEFKEFKEKNELKDILKEVLKDRKEFKHEKIEWLENNGGIKRIKDHKDQIEFHVPDFPIDPGQPIIRNNSLEERLSQLESVIGQLTPFIGQELRPDLTMGALSQESDAPTRDRMREQLQKQAADAVQTKTDFDNCNC